MHIEVLQPGDTSSPLLRKIRRLRVDVFEHELGLGLVRDPVNPERIRGDDADAWSYNLAMVDDGEVVGALRSTLAADGALEDQDSLLLDQWTDFVPLDRIALSSRFVVRPELRGSLVGPLLLGRSYLLRRERGVMLEFLDCKPDMVGAYQRMGFRRFRGPYLNEDLGAEYVPLVLFLADAGYMEAIGSQVPKEALRAFPSDTEVRRQFERHFPAAYAIPPYEELREDFELLCRSLGEPFGYYLTNSELAAEARAFARVRFEAGQIIAAAGASDDRAWVIARGEVQVQQIRPGGVTVLRTMGPGQHLGEIGVLTGAGRTATVVAYTDVEALELDGVQLRHQLQRYAPLTLAMIHRLAGWFTQTVARDDREALPLDGSPRLPPPPLDAETIALVEASAPRLTLNTGEWLARVDQTEGWRKATAWLISEGSVAVVSRAGEVVVEIGAGGLVGELTVLTGLPRTADLRAASPCVLRPLRRADLTSLVRLRPELGVILATRLATALHNRSVAARVATGPSRLPPVPSEGSAVR